MGHSSRYSLLIIPPLKVAETQIWPNLGSGVLLFWIFSQSRVGGSYYFEFQKYKILTVFPLISAKNRPKKSKKFLARFARRPIFFWGSYYFDFFSNLGSGGLIEGGFLLLIGLYCLKNRILLVVNQDISCQEPPPLPRKPPLVFESSDFEISRFWPKLGPQFWAL